MGTLHVGTDINVEYPIGLGRLNHRYYRLRKQDWKQLTCASTQQYKTARAVRVIICVQLHAHCNCDYAYCKQELTSFIIDNWGEPTYPQVKNPKKKLLTMHVLHTGI